ncbi:Uncharacterised protein [uncultured archaeon]|nr:Uncharacterised protein [uncultured archaeon]
MNEEITVENWEIISGFKVPSSMQKAMTANKNLSEEYGYGPLYDLASFAMRKMGSSSWSRFENKLLKIGTFSFSFQDFTYCGRSTVTGLLYVARIKEELLEARLIANHICEGIPRHRDSIHYDVKELDKDFARGEIYRSGFPARKLGEFEVSIN